MIFSSPSFFVFLMATLALYAVARTHRERAGLMLAASLVFYASWKPAYLLLLLASLAINYRLYLKLLRSRSRRVLILAVVLNLALLAGAKYFVFFTETLFALVNLVGLNAPQALPQWLHWALPLGISFYTFHMLSAMFDAYHRVWGKPVTFSRWCLYVTFFPHLIAGPILRPGQLIDQLGELGPLTADNLRLGGAIFAAGLVKKILFADNLAAIADSAYSNTAVLDAASAWLGTLAFAFQIYFDFSGYSEMAIGLALMFGVTLPRNFLYPYISRNPTDFWRRWHITLSLWLRDYLYIALGGNRRGGLRTYFNLFATMVLGGLWHGANWTFVVWGALHGVYLIGHRVLNLAFDRIGVRRAGAIDRALSLLGMPLMFTLVLVSWVFFRAASFTDAWAVLTALAGQSRATPATLNFRLYEFGIVGAAAILVAAEPRLVAFCERHGIAWWWRIPFALRGVAYAGLTLLFVTFGGVSQKFIYFDF